MFVKIISDLTVLEWALLAVLLLAVALVLAAAGLERERSLRSRPMPLAATPPRPPDHAARHAMEGETRRLHRGTAPAGPLRPQGRVSWLGSKDSQGWWIWSDDLDIPRD